MSDEGSPEGKGRRWPRWPPRLGPARPLSTRDIATIAILASLGGVMSAYIGYLGVALNKLAGTPFGAGQFLAGLHVFWMVLAVVLTDRVGAGTATGALKGTVELLAGSGKGVLVLLLSVAAGLIVDAVWALAPRRGLPSVTLAGGLGTASNIIVFLLFTSTYDGLHWLFLLLLVVAFVSGVVFAGVLVANVASTLSHAGILVGTPALGEGAWGTRSPGATRPPWTRKAVAGAAATVVATVLFFGGAIAYYVTVGENADALEGGTVRVEGRVRDAYSFDLEDFEGEEVTVVAELQGEFSHEPPRNYTGVPLRSIIARAQPEDGASVVHVVGVDEYGSQLDLPLGDVMDPGSADGYLLVSEHGQLRTGGTGDYYRLVCKDLDGGWWVRWVVRISVE